MTRDWKYILYISLAFGAFVVIKLTASTRHNWTVTFGAEDKDPYGGYALHELVRTLFPEGQTKHSFKTLYELKDSLKAGSAVFIAAEYFSPEKEDAMVLLDHVYKGGTAFISTQYLDGKFADTLKLVTNYTFRSLQPGTDSTNLRLVARSMDTVSHFAFRDEDAEHFLQQFDTTRTAVIAKSEFKKVVSIRMQWGAGVIVINTTPLMLTNIYLLAGDNYKFVSSQLSYLNNSSVYWTEYYQRGRREISTPLRFILLNEPLSWAYYITVISLLVFMLFETKRRQRIIPVIPPLPNTTLEFVSTIGDLYYQNGDHRNIAEKMISYFLEQVRSKHNLGTNQLDTAFASTLAKKSGKKVEDTSALIKVINEVRSKPEISAEGLIDLNTKLETFYNNE
jgi:hypothetical protein